MALPSSSLLPSSASSPLAQRTGLHPVSSHPGATAAESTAPPLASAYFPSLRTHGGTGGGVAGGSYKLSKTPVLKWRTRVSFFPSFLKKGKTRKSREALKEELLDVIAPLDRGAEATPKDQDRIDQIASELEVINTIKKPLNSDLLNGKWELLYTTSRSILQSQRPKFLRPNGKIYQAINVDTLRAQNMETWPYFNQVTANLVPLNERRVAVKFDTFKIAGLIPIKAPGRARGELEITYLDEEIRVSRGDKGNLFILKMVDPSYRVPV